MFKNITTNELDFPSPEDVQLSPYCRDLLTKLLVKEPSKRLGHICGIRDIKSHPFFHDVDWKKVSQRSVPPPPAYLSDMAMDIIAK